jgi:AraC family transcriptional regulator
MVEYLQQVVDYITTHLEVSLNLEMIATQVGFSKYYLNHLFKIYTGLSVMEFVRRKKLEAAMLAINSDNKIIDIAYQYGYNSERAFSRAITNAYGHSPKYFKQHRALITRELRIYDLHLKLQPDQLIDNLPDNFEAIKHELSQKGNLDMRQYLSAVHYEVIDAMTVISGTAIGNEPEDKIIQIMEHLIEQYQLPVLRKFGFDSPVDGSSDLRELRGYEYWLAVNDSTIQQHPSLNGLLFDGITLSIKSIPAYRYATLRISDPFSDPFVRIGTGWQALVSWLQEHDFQASDYQPCLNANCLEEVKQIDDQTVMDIFIPVDRY